MIDRIRGRRLQKRRRHFRTKEPLCRRCRKASEESPCAHGIKAHIVVWEELDHITPLTKGGKDNMGNLQPLCKACHEMKTIKDMGYRRKVQIGDDGWPII